VAGKSVWQGGMEEAPENGKESPYSVHANGLIDWPWTLLRDSINTSHHLTYFKITAYYYWGAGKSLARPGRKQARKHVRDTCDFNDIETRAVFKFFLLQGTAPKKIHAILTETLACFLPGQAKDLSAPLY